MARRQIALLPLASVGRVLVRSSRQLSPEDAARAPDRTVVLSRGPPNVQLIAGLPGRQAAEPSRVDRGERHGRISGQERGGRRGRAAWLDVTLPSAVRWLRRRIRGVRTALMHVSTAVAIGVLGNEPAPEIALPEGSMLLCLRRSLSPPSPSGASERPVAADRHRAQKSALRHDQYLPFPQ